MVNSPRKLLPLSLWVLMNITGPRKDHPVVSEQNLCPKFSFYTQPPLHPRIGFRKDCSSLKGLEDWTCGRCSLYPRASSHFISTTPPRIGFTLSQSEVFSGKLYQKLGRVSVTWWLAPFAPYPQLSPWTG